MYFTDNAGREWLIELNISSARRLNERLKQYELDLMDADQIVARLADVFFTANLLWLVCRDQAEERGIDEEGFGAALGGMTLFKARQALIDEYIAFFPDPNVQEKMRDILARSERLADAGRRAIARILEQRESEIMSAMNDGGVSSSSPAGPESSTTEP